MKTLLICGQILFTFAVFLEGAPHHESPLHGRAARNIFLTKLGRITNAGDRDNETRTMDSCNEEDLEIAEFYEKCKKGMSFTPDPQMEIIIQNCRSKLNLTEDSETAEFYEKCNQETSFTPDPQLEKILQNCRAKFNLTEDAEFTVGAMVDDYTGNCYWSCLSKGVGFTDEKGLLNKQNLFEKLVPPIDKEKALKTIEKCGKIERENECESIGLIYECLAKDNLYFDEFRGPFPPAREDQ